MCERERERLAIKLPAENAMAARRQKPISSDKQLCALFGLDRQELNALQSCQRA